MTTTRVLASLSVTVVLLTACGVQAQDDPHAVDLPRRPLNSVSSAPASEIPGKVAHELYLVHDDRLVPTVRRYEKKLNPQQQLDQLIAGPTPAEQARGLSTALGTIKLRVKQPITGAMAEVEVDAEGEEYEEGAARTDEVLVYGQIVCTLTSRADVAAVTFFRDGQQLRVPRGDLNLSGAPLRAADFRSLIGSA